MGIPMNDEKRNILSKELEKIRKQNDGILTPSDILNSAKYKTSPLHDFFCWDDNKAAEKYRLIQARQLISATVTIVGKNRVPVRAYVSLKKDRKGFNHETLGTCSYRSLKDVLSNNNSRQQLLKDALSDFESLKNKYIYLDELIDIFNVIDKAIRKFNS